MSESVEKVCIFIDDSNLFIEGTKFMAKQNHLVEKQDNRFRIEFSELIKVLAKNRPILCKNLYGSGSLSNYSVWMATREEGIQTHIFDRCYKGREKEVDSTLVADVVDKAACLRFEQPHRRPGSVTFIIVSGDRDYLQALRKVHKHGWKFEVVCWKTSISDRVRSFVKESQAKGAKLITLDKLMERAPSFYFIESRWSSETEGSHSYYAFEYNCPQEEEFAKQLSIQAVNLIKRPCQYLRPDDDPRMIKIVMLVDYKNHQQMETDERHMIQAFQHGTCNRVSFTDNKDTDDTALQDPDDDDDDEGSVEERCVYRYSCRSGKNCQRRHTSAEKEHFEVNSRHLGAKYKSRMCRDVPGRRCACMKNPRKCPWAHGLTDARCYFCDRGGLVGHHWMNNCPKKKRQLELRQLMTLEDFMPELSISTVSLNDIDEVDSGSFELHDDLDYDDPINIIDDESDYDSEL